MKDRFNIEGLESACGYASWLGEPKGSESEGALVKGLRSMGAVFFVKTNVPMSMLVSQKLNSVSLSGQNVIRGR
jgi:amidase